MIRGTNTPIKGVMPTIYASVVSDKIYFILLRVFANKGIFHNEPNRIYPP